MSKKIELVINDSTDINTSLKSLEGFSHLILWLISPDHEYEMQLNDLMENAELVNGVRTISNKNIPNISKDFLQRLCESDITILENFNLYLYLVPFTFTYDGQNATFKLDLNCFNKIKSLTISDYFSSRGLPSITEPIEGILLHEIILNSPLLKSLELKTRFKYWEVEKEENKGIALGEVIAQSNLKYFNYKTFHESEMNSSERNLIRDNIKAAVEDRINPKTSPILEQSFMSELDGLFDEVNIISILEGLYLLSIELGWLADWQLPIEEYTSTDLTCSNFFKPDYEYDSDSD